MRHLTPDELVDLAEGTPAARAAAHLDQCSECRRQVEELRVVMSVAADAPVPEPSPLYWDHFSRRVREAVALEGVAGGEIGWWTRVTAALGPRVAMSVAAAALVALILAVALPMRTGVNHAPVASNAASADVALDAEPLTDEASIALVADLTADMDLETAQDAGLAADGSADHAVSHLTPVELRELNRLLKEALAKPGA
jgi:hypothetical protein